MKNIIRLLTFIGAILFAQASFAQTTTVQTATTADILNTTVRQITVASTTGMSATTASQQYYVYIDQELMQVQAVVNSTTLTVARGYDSTAASPHEQGAVVTWGPMGAWNPGDTVSRGVFIHTDPAGTCSTGPTNPSVGTANPISSSSQQYTVVVNTRNGRFYRCNSTTSYWEGMPLVSSYITTRSYRDLGNAAATLTLMDDVVAYTQASAARTVTLPSITGIYGKTITVTQFSGPAGGMQTITVQPSNGQLINGSDSVTFTGVGLKFISYPVINGTTIGANGLSITGSRWATIP